MKHPPNHKTKSRTRDGKKTRHTRTGGWKKQVSKSGKRLLGTLAAVWPFSGSSAGSSSVALLTGEKDSSLPAKVFRKASARLRKAKSFTSAESICSRGLAWHPDDLELAIEHAEIATAAKNGRERIVRWQRAIDLSGKLPAVSTIRNLVASYRDRADFPGAETALREGLRLHPGNPVLMELLCEMLVAAKHSTKALEACREFIRACPRENHIPTYLRMDEALREEGLLDSAGELLGEALTRYPKAFELRGALERLDELRVPINEVNSPFGRNSPDHLTAHLFSDFLGSPGTAKICFSPGRSPHKQFVSAMLDFGSCVPFYREHVSKRDIDVFAVWGTPTKSQNPLLTIAEMRRKPVLWLDSGFIGFPGIEDKDSPACSFVASHGSHYGNASLPSQMEVLLNSEDFHLNETQRERAEKCISSIVTKRLGKFNHAPRENLAGRFPADGTKRVLLVDQRTGGSTVHWSWAGDGAFEKMLAEALAMPCNQVLVKLHPRTIDGSCGSHLLPLMPNPLPDNVVVIDHDVNPFDLFDVVEEVFVCTSQLGFEAAMAGKTVHCFGVPFYSGWGITVDRTAVPRRKMKRSIAEIFHVFYIAHSRYHVPGSGNGELEDLIEYLAGARGKAAEPVLDATPISPSSRPSAESIRTRPLRILIVIPGGRHGATGRYIQNLSESLLRENCEVVILGEGPCPRVEAGVRWLSLEFDGLRMEESLRNEIVEFAPDFIYENGVRSRSQRAALEAVIMTGARFAMQSEDDDIQIYSHRKGEKMLGQLVALDRPGLTSAEVVAYLREHDWEHTLNVLLDPGSDRWIEPALRILCYRMASIHTAIWHPFADRLAREYEVPTLVVPPVAAATDFERIPFTPDQRRAALERHGISPERTVFFIGGALYSYSEEYAKFLDALDLAVRSTGKKAALVVTSERSLMPLERMARERLCTSILFADLGRAGDEVYMEMLKACDIVCSPGLPDTFNRFRLPSRLVKAMAMGKPVLTCRCGFGESLEHNVNAFLTEGSDPAEWALAIAASFESSNRENVGRRGYEFACENFKSDLVAARLKEAFDQILDETPRSLADRITPSPPEASNDEAPSRTRPGIRVRSRCKSTLQPAIGGLSTIAHGLDTVVHIGAGMAGELEDYCRFGASHIVLVEGAADLVEHLRKSENSSRTVSVWHAVVSPHGGPHTVFVKPPDPHFPTIGLSRPVSERDGVSSATIDHEEHRETQSLAEICAEIPLESENNLLALETDGVELEILSATSTALLRKFRWIISRSPVRSIVENSEDRTALEEELSRSGFEPVALAPNYTDLQTPVLFRRTSHHPGGR